MNLTKPQKLIYDMEKYAGGSIAVICGSMLTPGKREITKLKRAVNEVYRLNDALRIHIVEDADGVSQSITAYKEKEIEVLRFEDKAELNSYAENYAKEPLDICGDLCAVKIVLLPEKYGLLVKLHHIIGDAWTLSLIGNQFNAILNDETPEAYSYADYVESEKEYVSSRRYERDKSFFLEQFQKCDEVTYLSEKQSDSFVASRKTFVIGKEEAKKITDYATTHETSAFMLFTAALSAYMNRVKMNAEKFYIGTAVLNRSTAKEKNTAGMFINTVPMLIELANEKSFAENLAGIQDTAFSVFRHQKYNYGDVLSDLRAKFGFGEKLYDVIISYQNASINGGNESIWYHCGMQTESLQIHIDDRDNEGVFRIHYDYLTDKYSEHDIEMLHAHLLNLLFSAIQDDSKKIHELDLLTADEKQKLLFDFNGTAVDYPRDKCVHMLFEEQVERTPEKVAVISCDKTLTYKELNEEANRIAHALIEKGVGVGDIVAFALPRKSYLISTIFGILKSGAAYLPIDPDYPQDRIEYMLSDSNAKLFITENTIPKLLNNSNNENPYVKMSSESLCYCIYTSGSTGMPKGTLLKHNGIVNLVTDLDIYSDLSDCNRFGFMTTITFDVATQEIFTTLLNGYTGVLFPERKITSIDEIVEKIISHKIDVIYATPTYFDYLTDVNENAKKVLNSIRVVCLAGEKFYLNQNVLDSDCENVYFENQYGPAEVHVITTTTTIERYRVDTLFNHFVHQAVKKRNQYAVISSNRFLTYKELFDEVDTYCAKLQNYGVKKGDIVAIHLNRSYELIVFQLAVLKAGAVFLPVDKRYPADRIKYMCEDCNVSILISDDLRELNDVHLISLNDFKTIVANNDSTTVPNDGVCYIIYTSGSTGKPKGCMLSSKGIVNFCKNNNTLKTLQKRENNIFACVNSVSFDYFIAESLLPLLNGYTTVILDDEESSNQELFLRAVKKYNINVLMTTPTRLKLFYNNSKNIDVLTQLNCICTSGEALQPELLEMIYLKSPQAQVYNPLGPSECTVWNFGGELDRNNGIDITIGKPIANTQIYIVDPYMNITPIGVTGELCIAGDGVGAGYLNRPELTAEKFINNPFGEGKLYKTGDIAYWREDGNIVYVGRNDFQVKIRGLRIELGEIENAISAIEVISQSVVIVRKNNEGRQLICAFYTGKVIDPREIRTQIGKKLPKYMLPHVFTHLDEMPLTTSGKINRKALPEVELYEIDTTVEYVAPQVAKEKVLVNAIESILKIEKVGVADNFFDLGGDSLKAIELISILEKQGYHTDIKTIFTFDTVKELAEKLTVITDEEHFNYSINTSTTQDDSTTQYASHTTNTAFVYIAPRTEKEKVLCKVISEVLKIDRIGLEDNFFDLGGDSLKVLELLSKVNRYGYQIDAKMVFNCDTVKELAEQLTIYTVKEEKLEYSAGTPASTAQMRVYTAQSMNADSTMYNVPYVFRAKAVRIENLQESIDAMLDRHEILRTCFENKDGTIIQVVDEKAICKVEQLANDDILSFVRPFDLSKAPLIRVGVYENTVMIDMHHIITDGGSMPVFLKELNELYMGRTLDTTPVPYKRFAVTPQDHSDSEKYWLEVYKDEVPELTINTDFKRGQKQSFNGSAVYDTVDIALHNKIQEYCKKQNITPYVFYMAAFNILLSKFSGCEDIVVGMPISGRDGKFLDTIGMFVNTIALRNKPTGTKTVEEFLQEVKENSISAIDHQDYPFGDLVKKLGANTSDRNPLFDVMFAYQSEQMTDVVFGDEKAELMPIPVTTSKYDFTFNILPREENVVIMVEYCTDLYNEHTIQRFIGGFRQLLSQMVDDNTQVKNVSPIALIEAKQIKRFFNDSTVDYPRDKCVYQLFEEQVEKTPDKVAVIACDKTLTYKELNEEANRIAHALIEKGVGVGDIVAFNLQRKSFLFSTIFGILKTGATYLPIDPDYPQDRIDYMLDDSNAKHCITEDSIEEMLSNSNNTNPGVVFSNDTICYCIYTSGSTGKPKGTLLTNKNVVNYCSKNDKNVLGSIICEHERIVSITTVGFDIFVTESILPILNGLEVILANEEEAKIPSSLNSLLCKTPADVLQTTPTKMKALISESAHRKYLEKIKTIILGGEALDKALVEQICRYTDAEIFNIYGPTETTVWSTNAKIRNYGQRLYSETSLQIKELTPNTDSERKHILCDFNDTAAPYPRDKCVHTLFEEQVEKTPDKIAVIACDKTLTYAELNEEANRIAHSLIEKGVVVGDIVAFALPRKSYLISTILGILKSGAAYLPIDPDYPQDRIEYMLKDSDAKFFITESNIAELFNNNNDENPDVMMTSDNLCYCIYTSGSTGMPKGVRILHHNFVNICNHNNKNHLTGFFMNGSVLLSIFNQVFDAFGIDYACTLLNNKSISLIEKQKATDVLAITDRIKRDNVDMLHMSPSLLSVFLSDESFLSILSQIKVIFVGAEAFDASLLMKLRLHTEAIIVNGYGPSEATIGNTFSRIEKEDITIGKPLANTQIYIVDPYMNITPIGVTGELCIAGDGVGAGYLNRPELTAEKFIDNPFGEGKLYKTGDLAYWREDGNIVYVGRNDFQVKIRGLRIELGEIENAISSVDGISQSVVIVRKNNEGRQLICAFYTGIEIEPKEIRAQIGKKLPKYMLPHIFTHLDEMPLTTSGKINRKALPEVDLYNIANDTEFSEPKTEQQKILCETMEEILDTSPIGITDDFFLHGGDSLKAIELVSKAHSMGIFIDLQGVFDHPTVEELCNLIETENEQVISFDNEDFSALNNLLAGNTTLQKTAPEKIDLGNILLAGATGFLGSHILDDFLKNDSGIAYCLVRGKDKHDSEERLESLLKRYFGEKNASCARIKAVCADLEKDDFGLSNEDYRSLAQKVDTVINCAATVKHYGSYKYFYNKNVETAKRLIEFSHQAGARLIHISTTSVSGDSFVDGIMLDNDNDEDVFFDESSFYIGQPLDNVYARSKFEAEKAVLDAMSDGLQANIMRMGNLSNRRSDGLFQKNYDSNAFLKHLKAMLDLGAVPDYIIDGHLEFTPIDEAANAVMTIARHFNSEHTVFHINNPKTIFIRKLEKLFRSLGIVLEYVSGEEFARLLRETTEKPETKHIFQTFINELDENDRLQYGDKIHVVNDFTVQYLKQLGFEWKDIDLEYMRRYVKYFRKIGYFK